METVAVIEIYFKKFGLICVLFWAQILLYMTKHESSFFLYQSLVFEKKSFISELRRVKNCIFSETGGEN